MTDPNGMFHCNDCSEEFEASVASCEIAGFEEAVCPTCQSRTRTLVELSITAAQEIDSSAAVIDLAKLTTLDADAARQLVGHHGYSIGRGYLILDGLQSLSVDTASALAKWEGEKLSINGLTSLPVDVAEALAQWKGAGYDDWAVQPPKSHLELNGITSLSTEEAVAIAKFPAAERLVQSRMDLCGLTELSVEAAQALTRSNALILDAKLPEMDTESTATILLSAASNLSVEIAWDLLTTHKSATNTCTPQGDTPLHLVADTTTYDPELAENACHSWLRDFTIRKKEDLIRLILSNGGDPNRRNANGNTPLHIIAANEVDQNSSKWIESLLKHKADPNIRDASGNTPLHLAVLNNYFWEFLDGHQVVLLLLQNGADPNAVNAEGETPLHLVVKAYVEGTRENLFSESLYSMFNSLMEFGADINRRNADGLAPIQLCDIADKFFGHDGNIFTNLLDSGANCNLQDLDGNTPLHLAIINCEDENLMLHRVRQLIEKNADLSVRNEEGKSALHLMADLWSGSDESDEVLRMLLDAGADPNMPDFDDNTALHLEAAIANGELVCVEALVDSKADINAVNRSGDTALHIAARNGDSDLVEYLLGIGAEIKTNALGETPLACAVEASSLKCVELLTNNKPS